DTDLFIPAQLTQGLSQITITIQFVSSSIDWDEFKYEAYSVVAGNNVAQPLLESWATYRVSSLASHLPVDLEGTAIVQKPRNASDTQLWRAIAAPGGSYALVNVNKGLVLDGAASGTPLNLATWTGNSTQLWRLSQSGPPGYLTVTNASSNLVL